MVDPVAASAPPSDAAVEARIRAARVGVMELRSVVSAVAGRPLTGRVLEVGAYDGAAAFALAALDDAAVVASDLARYYVVQRPGAPAADALEEQRRALAELRERTRLLAGARPGSVTFIEDDITATTLAPASFDAIVSFEVLEHVARPEATMVAIARLLRSGGIGYHVYNPFFSQVGGHSLCTLDFPWGHARLDAGDFQRYLEELRPDVVAQTQRFYTESLNRMTLSDLRAAVAAAGLEVLGLVPWSDRSLAAQLDESILADVRRQYPTATLEDLTATFVTLVVRRP
jgi:SAM-dependent methyltransferase